MYWTSVQAKNSILYFLAYANENSLTLVAKAILKVYVACLCAREQFLIYGFWRVYFFVFVVIAPL